MAYFDHEFTGVLERHALGRYVYRVVFLDPALEASLDFPKGGRLRIEAEIADLPLSGAWQPTPDGRHYVMVSPKLCREAGLSLGDPVEVRFRIVDAAEVEVPSALAAALALDETARAFCETLTPGKQRALAHRVASAKRAETQRRRVDEIIAQLRAGEGVSGPKRRVR